MDICYSKLPLCKRSSSPVQRSQTTYPSTAPLILPSRRAASRRRVCRARVQLLRLCHRLSRATVSNRARVCRRRTRRRDRQAVRCERDHQLVRRSGTSPARLRASRSPPCASSTSFTAELSLAAGTRGDLAAIQKQQSMRSATLGQIVHALKPSLRHYSRRGQRRNCKRDRRATPHTRRQRLHED